MTSEGRMENGEEVEGAGRRRRGFSPSLPSSQLTRRPQQAVVIPQGGAGGRGRHGRDGGQGGRGAGRVGKSGGHRRERKRANAEVEHPTDRPT